MTAAQIAALKRAQQSAQQFAEEQKSEDQQFAEEQKSEDQQFAEEQKVEEEPEFDPGDMDF
jgi:hypothetical protein